MARSPYREIIELYSTGISMKKVAYLCGIGINKARDVLVSSNPSRYQQLGAECAREVYTRGGGDRIEEAFVRAGHRTVSTVATTQDASQLRQVYAPVGVRPPLPGFAQLGPIVDTYFSTEVK